MSAVIRDATPEDAEEIAGTHIACWQEAYAEQLPADLLSSLDETFERRRTFWEQTASSDGRETLLVAEVNHDVVGFAHVCASRDEDADEATGEVTAIYLRKAYWGRGIGRRLFAEAEHRLRVLGFRRATLWVLDTNERTRRFYEAAGWTPDHLSKSEEIRGHAVTEVRYRKDLS